MIRRMIPLVVAIVLVVGCKKSGTTTAPAGEEGGGDPNATYTIKVRGPQQGDKVEVVSKEKTRMGSLKGKEEEGFTDEDVAEYTEQIVEMPADAPGPTKVTRIYKVAKKTDFKSKQLKSSSFEGKTLVLEKKGGKYQSLVDGKEVEAFELFKLDGELKGSDDKKMLDILLPTQPVKVGDTWNISSQKLLEDMKLPKSTVVDESKSKLTGKLARVYAQDGKQRGVIELDVRIEVKPDGKDKKDKGGWLTLTGTVDLVIDGSVPDIKLNLTFKLGANDEEKKDSGIEMNFEKSVKPAK